MTNAHGTRTVPWLPARCQGLAVRMYPAGACNPGVTVAVKYTNLCIDVPPPHF